MIYRQRRYATAAFTSPSVGDKYQRQTVRAAGDADGQVRRRLERTKRGHQVSECVVRNFGLSNDRCARWINDHRPG